MYNQRMENDLTLRKARKKLGLTMKDVAETAGVSLQTVWRWETDGLPQRGAARAFVDGLIEKAKRLPQPAE